MGTESNVKQGAFGAILLLLLGVAGLAAGGFLYLADQTEAERRAAALSEGPPPAIELQDFAAAPVFGPAGNVRVIAQVDFTLKKPITANDFLGERPGFALPLLPPTATALDRDQTLGVLLFTGDMAAFSDRQLERLLDRMVALGENGPIIDIEGQQSANPAFLSAANVAFAAEGRLLPSNVLVLEPYMDGRAWALAPGPTNYMPYGVAALGAVLSVLGLTLMMRRSSGGATAPVAQAARHVMIPAYVPEMASGTGGAAALKRVLNPAEQGAGVVSVYSPRKEEEWDLSTADDIEPDEFEITSELVAGADAADNAELSEEPCDSAETAQPEAVADSDESPKAEPVAPQEQSLGMDISEVLAMADALNRGEEPPAADAEAETPAADTPGTEISMGDTVNGGEVAEEPVEELETLKDDVDEAGLTEEEVEAILAEELEDWDDEDFEEDDDDAETLEAPQAATRNTSSSTFFSAVRLMPKDDKNRELSKRDSARLEADPMVKRLAKIG